MRNKSTLSQIFSSLKLIILFAILFLISKAYLSNIIYGTKYPTDYEFFGSTEKEYLEYFKEK